MSTPTAPAEIRLPATLAHLAFSVVDLDHRPGHPPSIDTLAVLRLTGAAPATPGDMRTWVVDPHGKVTPAAPRAVHGLADPETGLPWPCIAPAIIAAIESRILVAHDAPAVLDVLAAVLPNLQLPLVIDTRRLAQSRWPGLPDHDLGILAASVPGRPPSWRHRPAGSAWMAAQVFTRLAHEMPWAAIHAAGGLPATRTHTGRLRSA